MSPRNPISLSFSSEEESKKIDNFDPSPIIGGQKAQQKKEQGQDEPTVNPKPAHQAPDKKCEGSEQPKPTETRIDLKLVVADSQDSNPLITSLES